MSDYELLVEVEKVLDDAESVFTAQGFTRRTERLRDVLRQVREELDK